MDLLEFPRPLPFPISTCSTMKSKSSSLVMLLPVCRIQDIIIFIIGGATYEEARFVADLNKKGQWKIVLGGTSIHNSQRYVSNLTLKTE